MPDHDDELEDRLRRTFRWVAGSMEDTGEIESLSAVRRFHPVAVDHGEDGAFLDEEPPRAGSTIESSAVGLGGRNSVTPCSGRALRRLRGGGDRRTEIGTASIVKPECPNGTSSCDLGARSDDRRRQLEYYVFVYAGSGKDSHNHNDDNVRPQ